MKTKLTKMIMSSFAVGCALMCLAATMALGPGSSATARPDHDSPSCNEGMLRGLYLWTFAGYQYFGGNPVPKTLIAGIQFNGNGTLNIPFGTVNVGGNVHEDNTAVGTYTVAADCTGTLRVTGGTSFYMFVGSDGKELSLMQTGGGPGAGTGVALGTATRQ